MTLLFRPSPPPCAKCGTMTVVAPAFDEGQRIFVVRCPACGRSGTYSLNYSTRRERARLNGPVSCFAAQAAVQPTVRAE